MPRRPADPSNPHDPADAPTDPDAQSSAPARPASTRGTDPVVPRQDPGARQNHVARKCAEIAIGVLSRHGVIVPAVAHIAMIEAFVDFVGTKATP